MKIKKFKTAALSKEIMKKYYESTRSAHSEGKKVVWCTALAPAEFFWAMDFVPVFPENHAATCGAYRMTPSLSDVAEQDGLSRDVCSYVRADWGSRLTGDSPLGGLPKPDFVFCGNNSCQTVTKWYEELSRFFNVPMFQLDTVYNYGDVTQHSIDYIVKQFKDLIVVLEEVAGKEFDMERFREIMRISHETTKVWNECLEMGRHTPSPITLSDILTIMGPIVCLRGTEDALRLFTAMRDEIQERVDNGIAAVDNEKFRLIWDNIPLWYALRTLTEQLMSHGGVIVGATYLYHWCFDLDEDNLFETMARSFTATMTLNTGIAHKSDKIQNLLTRFNADGLIIHSNRSCKPDAIGSLDIQRRIYDNTKIPSLLFEADHTDYRSYAEGPVATRIEAFLESLENNKKIKA